MIKSLKAVKSYISLFTYDPIQTILNLLNDKKITQIKLAEYLNINERSVRKYFLRKTKLNKRFVLVVSVVTELPMQETLVLFKICKLEITLLNKDPMYFEFIRNMENNTIEENLEIIYKNNL